MRIQTVVAALSLLIGTAALPAGAPAEAWKCPPDSSPTFADAPDFVILVDRKVVTQQAYEQMDKKSIESIDVLCADPLHRAYGVKAKMSGLVVFTAPGPDAAVRAAFESIARLQQAHLREHGAFTTDLARLGWKDETGLISIDLALNDNGNRWVATGRHQHRFGFVATTVGDKP